MLVTLIAHTNDPEKTIAAAAKLCYSDAHIETLLDGLTPEKTAAFLQKLNDFGHASPIEHASFTFGIEGVSRTFLAQVTRHRIASFSVQSQRYVRLEDFRYVIPPKLRLTLRPKRLFIDAMNTDAKHYLELVKALEEKAYPHLDGAGHAGKDRPRQSQQNGKRGRPLCIAQRLRDKNGNDHELPQPEQLFQPALLLQPCPVGDPRRCR